MQLVAVGLGDDPGRREHRRVRARLRDVVGREAPVEAGRRVQPPEDRVLWLREARHGRASSQAMAFTVRPARPDDRAGPRLLYLSAQPYYDAYTGSPERARADARGDLAASRVTPPAYDALPRAPSSTARSVGAIVAFPADDGDALARRFLLVSLLRLGVWRWPHVFRHLRASAEVMPVPPARLVLRRRARGRPRHRRRRAPRRALLADAERPRPQRGLAGVSLDTGLDEPRRAGALRGLRLRACAASGARRDSASRRRSAARALSLTSSRYRQWADGRRWTGW